MKAIVQNGYGSTDVLRLEEIDPPAVEENEVLVRVRAAAVNAGDAFMMRGRPWAIRLAFGFRKPKRPLLGWDVAGQVEAVGKNVRKFRPGDDVFGEGKGAFAEFVSAAAERFEMKPDSLSFEQAAAVPTAALTALQALRDKGKLRPGQKVLINGASGGVGTFAVQIAKSFGAEVTGVCSTKNAALVLSIGADHVVDYTKEDFTRGSWRYDIILDNVANRSFSELRRALSPRGIVIPNSGHAGMGYIVKAYVLSAFMRRQGRPFVASSSPEDLAVLKGLLEAGKIKSVIDRTYPLRETPEAVGYVGRGHAAGKVVITVS